MKHPKRLAILFALLLLTPVVLAVVLFLVYRRGPVGKRSEAMTAEANEVRARASAPSGGIHRFEGLREGDFFGLSVGGGGDVDGDGQPDVLVGAYDYLEQLPRIWGGEASPTPGYVQVFSGRDGSCLHAFVGKDADHAFGASVAFAGDVDGDGHADVLVGSPYLSMSLVRLVLGEFLAKPGAVQVFSGADGSVLGTLRGPEREALFGWSVAGLGDVDGDGRPDVVVSSGDLDGPGRVLVLSVRDGRILHRFDLEPGTGGTNAVAAAGDVDGDGVPDLVYGARGASREFRDAGVARVVSLATGKTLWTWRGADPYDYFGESVAGIGDVNGDGTPDLLVGATGVERAGPHAGAAYVYSGRDGSELHAIDGPAAESSFGTQVCGIDDVSGDGVPDFVVSARKEGAAWPGRARVYSGRNGDLLFSTEGTALAPAGDLTGDGRVELVVGSTRSDSGTADEPGLVTVVSVAAAEEEGR